MNKNKKNYLDFLNKSQKKAVTKTEGSFLVLAGAGSGKTRVLTYRVLHILLEKKAFPNQILSVTFTNKAASEMKSRIVNLLNHPVDRMWIGTFHSLSAKILRKHSELVGLKNNFIIMGTDDQLKLIKQICERKKINLKEKTPKYYLSIIDNHKNKSIHPIPNNKNRDVSDVYKEYQNELIRLNCVDFGDLIIHCIKIFTKNNEILLQYQKQFKYILVDEFQDINNVQQIWLSKLYSFYNNICCVGDDDQSIYSWRGAEISNLLNFEKKFFNPEIIRLEENYRSTQNILECASTLIKKNKGRYGKKLWSRNEQGEKIFITGFWETKEESVFISDEIEKLLNQKISYSEIAILFRVAAHTRSFEERFINIGLPYKIIGGLRFYERKEIRDAIAYLRLVNNFSDDLAFDRIINVPKRGVGKTTIQKINFFSREKNISMFEASEIYVRNNSSKISVQISDFLTKIYKWKKLKKEVSLIEMVQIILEDSGYIDFLKSEEKNLKNIENINRLDNINEFIQSLNEFENLEGFLEHVGLVMENISRTSDQTISLMTMHSAKGLEFDNIFLVGWEEGVFPSKKSLEEFGNAGLEEERRLAYVALTRARKKLFITYVNQNRYSYASHDYNMPSRFIAELPKNLIEHKDSNYFNNNNNFIEDFINLEEKSDVVLTPGRKRLLYNSKRESIEWDFNQDINEDRSFIEGKRVFHQKFGYGKIIYIDGEFAGVMFEKNHQQKKVFLKYLQIIN